MTDSSNLTPPSEEGYIFTFHRIGIHVKVTAIDEETGIEVCTITPYTLSQKDMQTVALRKLKSVLKKQNDNNT